MKKHLYFFVLIFSLNLMFTQENIDLEKAIDLALINSDVYKQATEELAYSKINTKLFNKTFLPSIYASSVFPSVSKSVTRITTPDGNDIFVNQNLAYYDLSLNVEQKEPIFGGTFTISSFFNRIDLFSEQNNTTYFSTPFSISYANPSFIFNISKYERIINQLRIDEDIMNYNFQLESVVYETVEKYFQAYIADKKFQERKKALEDIEEIYTIAEKRFKIGSINKGDLLTLELSILDTKSSLNVLLLELENSRKALSNFIKNNSSTIKLIKPKEDILNKEISYELALSKMFENNKLFKELERKKIEKDLEIKRFKSENKLSLNIDAAYGLSNTSASFIESNRNLQDQQSFTIALKYLLFDFGKNKQKLKLLNIEKQILDNEYMIEMDGLKEKLFNSVNQYNILNKRLTLLKDKLEISDERYDFYMKRFSLGKTTITDINIAQREYQLTDNDYQTTLKDIWITYFNIRKLTMYDFERGKNIKY